MRTPLGEALRRVSNGTGPVSKNGARLDAESDEPITTAALAAEITKDSNLVGVPSYGHSAPKGSDP